MRSRCLLPLHYCPNWCHAIKFVNIMRAGTKSQSVLEQTETPQESSMKLEEECRECSDLHIRIFSKMGNEMG